MHRAVVPWLITGLVVSSLAALQVGLSQRRLELAERQHQLQRRLRGLQHETDRLRVELATLTRPERIRRQASGRLGMRPPLPQQVLRP